MVFPIDRFSFSSCDLYRTFQSLSNISVISSLEAPRPEFLSCNVDKGLSLDFDWTDDNPTDKKFPILISTTELNSLQQQLSEDKYGFSLAAWITPASSHRFQIQPILSIEFPGYFENPVDVVSQLGCPGFDLQITQHQRSFVVSYTDGNQACRHIRFSQETLINEGIRYHVGVAFSAGMTYIYLNGKQLGAPNLFELPILNHWNLANSTFQLFASCTTNELFRGYIHQVDIFDHFLQSSESENLYQEGAISVPGYKVRVAAKGEEDLNVIRQDSEEPLVLRLGSLNVTSKVLQQKIHIISLPMHGTLTNGGNQVLFDSLHPIAMGDSLVQFTYLNWSADYFNNPHGLSNPEEFHFRVIAFDKNSNLLAVSRPFRQVIRIVHVNHSPVLTTPDSAILDTVDPSSAIATGIHLDDSLDHDLDRIRVDIWSGFGEITLNPNYLGLANFETCRKNRIPNWNCVGDGIADRNMTFVAYPSEIQFILRNLSYRRSENSESEDEILIRVSDGSGGLCLDDDDHDEKQNSTVGGLATIRDGCFQVKNSIRVPVYQINDQPKQKQNESENNFFEFLSLADWLFWALVVFIVSACASCCRSLFPCLARGKPVDADSDGVGEDEIPNHVTNAVLGA